MHIVHWCRLCTGGAVSDTSAHPFDTLVTGLNGCRVGGTPCYDGRYGAHRVGHLGGHLSGYLETVPDAL